MSGLCGGDARRGHLAHLLASRRLAFWKRREAGLILTAWGRHRSPGALGAAGARRRTARVPGADGTHCFDRLRQLALIEIALFILGTPTDLKEMLPDTSSQQAEPAPSFHQY